MSLTARKVTAALLATGLFAFSSAALATNGYFTHGVGTASKGMAGTGVGSNADMGAIMTPSNPALGVFTDDSWEIGLSIFSPMRSYTASGSMLNGNLIDLGNGSFLPSFTVGENGQVDSSSEYFPIPYVAKNWSLANDANVTFAFYGRGGMNTDWDASNASATSYFCGGDPMAMEPPATGPGPYCAGKAGVDLMQAFLAVNYSMEVGDNFAWGIGPVFAVQLFEAKGIATFAPVAESFAASGGTQFPTSLTDNGHDTSTGFGFAAGVWWGVSDTFSLGLAYQSKMSMSEFDDYSDLFAGQGGFDIPSSIKLGLSFKASDTFRVNFDVEEIAYGDVDSIANPMANLVACPTLPLGGTSLSNCLGGDNGGGFGWHDMTVYKFGMEWMASESSTWRFGYSQGDQPIQPADVLFNVLAPGVMEQHITVGLTKQRANGGAWNFSFMYAPKETVSGPNMFDQTQTIELEMTQLEFEVGFTF